MNVLILLDLVPKYHQLLVGVGRALEASGHRTFYAMDSPQNLERFPNHEPPGPVRIFSKHEGQQLELPQEGLAPWKAFFPDFDRYENYGINYGRKQDWYRDLGNRLDSFFERCVVDWDIDLIVYEGVTNSFAYFANRAAGRHALRYIGIQGSRLPGRHELHGPCEDVLRQRIKGHYEEVVAGRKLEPEAREWVAGYLERFSEATPDYMKSNGLLLQNPVTKYLKRENWMTFARLARYQLFRRSPEELNYRSGPPLSYSWSHIRRNVVRWVRSKTLAGFFSQPGEGEEYYLYPLHFHPEASTSVNSRWYVDEYPVIKNLAFSLPPGRWLYVKDHPSAYGLPTRAFYRKVASLPNVRLIRPEEDTKRLIAESVGLITQTSTAGFETLVLGKPVWVLGEVFYDFHPGCCKIGWGEELAESLVTHETKVDPGDDQATHLVMAYYLSTMPGSLPLGGEVAGAATYQALADELEEAAGRSEDSLQ